MGQFVLFTQKKVFIMCLNNNSFSFELKTPHELGAESFSGS